MDRRNFIQKSAVAASVPLLAGSCKTGSTSNESTALVDQVKKAMLTMQRASWEQGVAAQACLEYGDFETAILLAKEAVLRQREDGRLAIIYSSSGVTDPASAGEAVLYAAEQLNNQDLSRAAKNMLEYLLNKAPKSESGTIYHMNNSQEFWIDSMYMSPPFLAACGEFPEAIKQIEGMRNALWNKEKKLYSHRWDDQNNSFINEKLWGVGNGWALAGISRVIKALPEVHNEEKERLIRFNLEHLDSVIEYMRSDGYFHNVIDDESSFMETNLGQMVAYTIYEGITNNWLPNSYSEKANLMRKAAHKKIDGYGYIQDVCGAPYFDRPGRATEGQAFFLLMEAARNKYLRKI